MRRRRIRQASQGLRPFGSLDLRRTSPRPILRSRRSQFTSRRGERAMISTRTLDEPEVATVDLPEVPEQVVHDLTQVFKLLADETRLRILFYLTRTRELHVRALCDLLDQSQPAVSHHLALMRQAELIELR